MIDVFAERETSTAEPQSIFNELQSHGDFDFWAAYQIPKTQHETFDLNGKNVWFQYDKCWESYYFDHKLHQIDPVYKFSAQTSFASSWRSLADRFCRDGRYHKFLQIAQDFGIGSGVCMALRQINGDMQIISFARRNQAEYNERELNLATYYGQIMGRTINQHIANTDEPDKLEISARSVECLELCALGKTSSEIECILGISRHTVDFHVRNAMKALNASSRTFAVVRAVQLGIVSP